MNAQPKPIMLAPELVDAVNAAVAAGDYASPAEAVAEAVREWAERRDNFGYTIEELRELVQEGIDSGPGRYDTMDDLKAEARRRFRKTSDAA